MSIEFRCTQCGKLLRTGDDTTGKPAMCPECGAVTRIPPAGAAPGGVAPAASGNPFQPASLLTPLDPNQPQAPIRPSPLDLSDVFSRTWTIFMPNWGPCLVTLIVVWLIGVAANFAANFIPIVGPLAAMLFGFWLGIGQALFFLKTARGQQADLGDIFTGWPYFVDVLLASLLLGLIQFGIALVLVLPLALMGLAISQEAAVVLGIAGGLVAVGVVVYVAITFSQFYYLILDRNLGVIDALKMSRELTQGNKLTLLGISLLSVLITIVAAIPCGLGLLAALPYFAVMHPVIYLTITGQPTAVPSQARTAK